MAEILMSVTLLIGAILLLRYLTRGRISMKFRYVLWSIVALRLLLPLSFGSSTFSVLNLVPVWPERSVGEAEAGATSKTDIRNAIEGWNSLVNNATDKAEYGAAESAGRETGQVDVQQTGGQKTKQLLTKGYTENESTTREGMGELEIMRIRTLIMGLWIFGAVGIGGCMLVNHLRLVRYLHRRRVEVPADELPGIWRKRVKVRRIRVFLVKGLPGPCLVGRNIYMEPQIWQDKGRLRHVLAHEYAHFIQGDVFWAFLRSILCVVYWFYPLIWVAAYAARRDSELACDERVIRILGEKERFAYGRTLLDLFVNRGTAMRGAGAVLIVGGRGNSVKERISMIAAKKKNSRTAAVLAASVMILACGCAFTGPESSDSDVAGKGKEILLTNKGDLMSGSTDGQKAAEKEDAAQERRSEETNQGQQDVTAVGSEQTEFEKLLFSMEDTALESAEMVDTGKYYEYLFEETACPMEDGQWYRLLQEGESGIEFYGLYTEEYGFRGMKIEIDGDVNTFDEPWLPTLSGGIKVKILEEAESDGLPRSFAFTECVVNTNTSEIWRLYVADRYDTGTIELYCFEEEDYRRQIEEQGIELLLTQEQEERTVSLIQNGTEEIGSVDISRYNGDDVEKVIWDEGSACFQMTGEGREAVTLITGIGLKLANSSDVRFGDLSLIEFPVDVGSFGEHKFLLRMPNVSADYVCGRRDR